MVWDSAHCSKKTCHFSVKTQLKEVINPFLIKQMLELDFSERKVEGRMLSQNDRNFLKKMEERIHQEHDGHYKMPLPFREGALSLPNNRAIALHCLGKLRA